jgi:hypothetical protein
MSAYTLREDRDRAIQTLAREYPKAFFVVGERRKPLKIGIEKDVEADMAKDNDSPLLDYDIDDAIAWYQSHVGYLKACAAAGTWRVDLQGKPTTKITASEAVEAEQDAQEGFARMAARRKTNNNLPAFVTDSPVTKVAVPPPPVFAARTSDELLDELAKQIALVKLVLSADPNDLLRKQLAFTALETMSAEIKIVADRLRQSPAY